jgi:hypothetical protein
LLALIASLGLMKQGPRKDPVVLAWTVTPIVVPVLMVIAFALVELPRGRRRSYGIGVGKVLSLVR